MVRLLRGGEPVKMSKRSGNFVTLADVVEEVGKDVVRFSMLTRKTDAQMDFDFAKVVEASKDNPVFYVQYAHARISSLKRKAADAGVSLDMPADLDLLDDEELALVKLAAQYPRTVEAAAHGARAAPDRLLPVRSGGRVPCPVEPRQRRSRNAVSSLKTIHNFHARDWNWRSASGKSSVAVWG